MVVWPDWMTRQLAEILVLENAASIFHYLAAIAIAAAGCARPATAAYTLYQVYTTIAKTLAFPEHTLADWPTDLLGDTIEFIAGAGTAWLLGIDSEIRLPGKAAKACTWKGIMMALAALTLVWLAFFIRDLTI